MKLYKIAQSSIEILPRDSETIMNLINSFGSKRYMLGYRKKDGSYRIMHAQNRVDKYKTEPEYIADPSYQQTREHYGLINIYDLDVARREKAKIGTSLDHLPKEEKERQIEKALRKSYRSIYPDKVEVIKGLGRVWVIENPQEPENIELLERANLENQRVEQQREETQDIEETQEYIPEAIAKSFTWYKKAKLEEIPDSIQKIFGLGKYKPKTKYKECPKCNNKKAYFKEIHPDTDMNEIILYCKDCGDVNELV